MDSRITTRTKAAASGTRLAILLTATGLLLSACGFHLRGNYEMPAGMTSVTLIVPDQSGALKKELELMLKRSGVSTDGGDTQLEVTREVLTKQTATVDSSAKAAEYTLLYAVDYRINQLDAKTEGPVQKLILRRGYQYDSTNIVGKSTEEETLVQEMRQDTANQIVRQLRSYTPTTGTPAAEAATTSVSAPASAPATPAAPAPAP